MTETALVAFHVLAAAVWVGGTVVLVFVAVPILRSFEGVERAALLAQLGRRWRPLGWGSLAILVLTGAAMAARQDAFHGARAAFDAVLTVKVGLVAALALGAYAHDFVLGPRLQRQIRERRPQTVRRRLILVGWLTFMLTLVVPVLGVTLAELAG